nr:M56 family metallopeptidase [uncultured Mucilaginibacter sp.]
MKTLIYLLQVSACTGIFYAFYYLFLRRLTFFTVNRWYLLASLLLSFVIPALSFTVDAVAPSPMMEPVIYVQKMQTITQAEPAVNIVNNTQPFDWMNAVKLAYMTIATISVLHLIVTLMSFFGRMKRKKLMQIGNVRVLKGDKKIGNSSFLNVIFIDMDELEPEEIKQIIAHEMLHVKLMHSADRIVARVVQVILWFNPFAYLYMRSIEENHEFEVDRIAAGEDEKGIYAQLLFKLAVSGQSYLFHSFSKVPLKKRIAMLFNKPTSNMKKIIYLLILPVVMISCLAFANLRSDEKLSVINDLSGMGPHPLVLIDGKSYPDDILYKISGKCVITTTTFNPPVVRAEYKKYGDKLKDGLVIIQTKNQKITYQTPIERENLAKKAAVPQNQFFTRLQLTSESGNLYEEGMVKLPGKGTMSSEFKVGEKVVFLIGGKAYPESEVKEVEELVKQFKPKSYSVAPVKSNPHLIKADYSNYETFYYFDIDTAKYRQKIWRNGKRVYPDRKTFEDYHNSAQGKHDRAASQRVSAKALTFKVVGKADTTYPNMFAGHLKGYKVTQGGDEFVLQAGGKYKAIEGLVQPGDEVEIKVAMCVYGNDSPLTISPETITKGGKVVFQAEKEEIPQYAFLYEANRVRFTDGKVTDVQKYPNGNWKSAVVEVANGYRIKFNLKPSAPTVKNIAAGDHVWLRFVHEVKTGAKEYTVNDWVAVSNNIKDYGVKNPEYFYKFYEKI